MDVNVNHMHAVVITFVPVQSLRLNWPLLSLKEKKEEAIKVIHVIDGKETCTVGFLPKSILKDKRYHYLNKMARIILCYEDSPDKDIRKRDYKNKGVASFTFIQDEIKK